MCFLATNSKTAPVYQSSFFVSRITRNGGRFEAELHKSGEVEEQHTENNHHSYDRPNNVKQFCVFFVAKK